MPSIQVKLRRQRNSNSQTNAQELIFINKTNACSDMSSTSRGERHRINKYIGEGCYTRSWMILPDNSRTSLLENLLSVNENRKSRRTTQISSKIQAKKSLRELSNPRNGSSRQEFNAGIPRSPAVTISNHDSHEPQIIVWDSTELGTTDELLALRISNVRPSSPLDGKRNDPFNSFPIPWNADVDDLFSYRKLCPQESLITDSVVGQYLGPKMFGYEPTSNIGTFQSIAALSLKDPAPFHCLLWFTTMMRESFSGQLYPGQRARYHLHEGLRILASRFSEGDPNDMLSEGTILAFMAMTIAKNWQATSRDFNEHNFQRLLIRKGGLRALHRQHPAVEMIVWVGVSYTSGLLDLSVPALYNSSPDRRNDLSRKRTLSLELRSFLKLVSRTLLNAHKLFGHDTPAFQLITSRSNIPGILQQNIDNARQSLSWAVVIYTLGMLTGIQDQESIDTRLGSIASRTWMWRNSMYMLLSMLVRNDGSATLEDSVLAWKTLRLRYAITLCPQATQDAIWTSLLSTLTSDGGHNSTMDDLDLDMRIHDK